MLEGGVDEDWAGVEDTDGEVEDPVVAVDMPPLSSFFARFFSFARLFWNHTYTTRKKKREKSAKRTQ